MLARLVAGVARQLARGLHHEIVPEEDDEEAQGGMGNAGPGPVPLEEARPQAALLLAEERAHGGRTALWCVGVGVDVGVRGGNDRLTRTQNDQQVGDLHGAQRVRGAAPGLRCVDP